MADARVVVADEDMLKVEGVVSKLESDGQLQKIIIF